MNQHNYFLITIAVITIIFTISCTGQNDYQQEGLKWHNQFRKKHGAKAMKLLDELNQIAQDCAEENAKRGTLDAKGCHKEGVRAGLNLFISSRKFDPVTFARNAVNSWYNTSATYDYDNPSKSPSLTGCFTQVVWIGSRQLGVGVASSGATECDFGGKKYPNCTVVAAAYKPPGNVRDKNGGYSLYQKNVKRPSSF